jgi:hypothetical protein
MRTAINSAKPNTCLRMNSNACRFRSEWLYLITAILAVTQLAYCQNFNIDSVASVFNYRYAALHAAISGNYCLTAAYNRGINVVDISNPNNPRAVSRCVVPGTVFDMEIIANIAFVVCGDSGLVILDASDPINMTEISRFRTPSRLDWLCIQNDIAYLATASSVIEVDIGDPANLVELTAIEVGAPNGVWLHNNDIYLSPGRGRVLIYDNSENPQEIGYVNAPGGGFGATFKDSLLFLADNTNGLLVFDVSDPTQPAQIASYGSDGTAYATAVSNQILYFAEGTSGLSVLDISDPVNLRCVGRYNTAGEAIFPVCGDSNLVYVADVTNFGVYRYTPGNGVIRKPEAPVFSFGLNSAFPNPFNATTSMFFSLSRPGSVRVTIYDLLGNEVAVLADSYLNHPGIQKVVWDASRAAPGIYFCRLVSGSQMASTRLLLIK